MDLLIATANPNKVREFREMLGGDSRFSWRDLSSLPATEPVEETGRTFLANACLKASTYATRFNTWALADDSGLQVDALAGNPGVTSARWAQLHNAGKGDAANNALLLEQLKNIPGEGRSARFVCALALSDDKGRIVLTAQDFLRGVMLRSPRGSNGFGYDPLFLITELDRTSAELPSDEKHRVSHRGRALGRLKALIERAM